MALLTIADLEVASNQNIEESDEAYYQWYIDAVSAYLEDYTGMTFGLVEEEEIYCDSGKYGSIQLSGLSSITSVALLDRSVSTYTTLISGDYTFDGIDTIYNLFPHQTYKLVVDYGFEEIPATIASVATQLVLAGSGLDPDAIGGLTEISVGDIMEKYGVSRSSSGDPVVSVSSIQSGALARYASRNRTWRV